MTSPLYCAYDFYNNWPKNPGAILWDPKVVGVECGKEQQMTEDDFRKLCGGRAHTVVGMDGVLFDQLCVPKGEINSMGAAGMMCTQQWGQKPWCGAGVAAQQKSHHK